ncbi:MAG: AraC family transcriptional regulator ligand-binding domain-containing protein [Deltaproteobacteria bacterium]|nr:AraC family transcriptional regulator ligand-binding domain-containing protein [Deltaproteobacteria bacterium]
MSTVVAAWTKVIVDYAASRGLDVRRPDVDLSRPDERIPSHLDDAIWASAVARLGDDVGLQLAETSVSVSSFGMLGYLLRASATVGEALLRVHQYHRLAKDRARIELLWSPAGVTVVESPCPERGSWPRAIAECVLANYVHMARGWSGVRLTPLEVRFQHPRPRSARELERFFGCRVRFDAGENALVFTHETLAVPFVTAEPLLAQYLTAMASGRLEELRPEGGGVVDEVRLAITAELRGGGDEPSLSIGRVARRLGATPRSLQRRLRAEGVSYRELVDAVRHRRAIELVQRGIPSHDIADQLGFSEPRAFRRAFRRWTGILPSALRRA